MANRDRLHPSPPITKELSPIEAAALEFVRLVQATDVENDGDVEKFESQLLPAERLAWHDLTAAIAGWKILYG